ncbi:extensin family protein [Gemmobacter sp. 24YEA27]|uniref:extensin-like domain-containing protein n=1 Tax=Gemmobacter sp. 24YEA27 TaxID=3040672 RepID=UPI0024B39A08|nr:extensin family protein [Gemmobacter sp. 24YEA27]
MKPRFAALLLLFPLAMTPAFAEPMKRSPRPLANPVLAVSTAAAGPANLSPPVPALIGPGLPAPAVATAKPSIPAPPANPRLDVIRLSSSNKVSSSVAEPLMGPVAGPVAGPVLAEAASHLPLIGEMLPASMPLPQPTASPGPASVAPVAKAAPSPAPGTTAVVATAAAPPPGPRPKARPKAVEKLAQTQSAPAPETAAAPPVAEASAAGLATSLRPKQRPAKIIGLASAAIPVSATVPKVVPEKDTSRGKKKSKEPASVKGSVCGVAAIKGEKIAPITSKVQGCGLPDGVRVTSVSGVRLSMAVTIDCGTARALNTWVERVAQPAYGNQIAELQIAGHYVCRPRNNKKGAKVSEHGRGKAVDISGIRLASGKVLRVLGGFDQTMRKAHKGACGIFGTTLGPGSDGYHEDHMHFDTASHRNGAYCR